MDWAQFLIAGTAILNVLLGGGLLAVWLRYRLRLRELISADRSQSREEERADFEIITAAMKDQYNEQLAYSRRQDEKIERLEGEIQGLRLARDLDPFPNWIVDLSGRYQYVNREFERHFLAADGRTYRDVIGKSHEEVGWPEGFCRTVRALDVKARSTPNGRARAKTTLGDSQVVVYKFPIRVAGIVVAYAGFITDMDFEDDAERIGT